jgi:hypothetical protein
MTNSAESTDSHPADDLLIDPADELLIDAPLIADPDADEEMGPSDLAAIADEDLKGSRLLVVRRAVEPIDLDGTAGGLVQLACTFQPAERTRFTSAHFRLRVTAPPEARIVDLAPRVIQDSNPVEFTFDNTGKLGIQWPLLESNVESSSQRKYTTYHCRVQGSGEGTTMARWDFREDPDRQDGLGQEQVLNFTLPVTGPITGSVIVSARLARSGVQGKLEAIRDLVLGSSPVERHYAIAFTIPPSPSSRGLARWFRRL